MSEDASSRIGTNTTRLSRATLMVLDHLRLSPGDSSSRHIAEQLTLSRRTVQAALDRLDELDLIVTEPGRPNRAAAYLVQPAALEILKGGAELRQVPVKKRVLDGGAICASTWRKTEEKRDLSTGAYKESLITELSTEIVSVCPDCATLRKTHPPFQTESAFEELIAVAEAVTGFPFDEKLRTRYAALLKKLALRPLVLIQFIEEKHRDKLRSTRGRWLWTSAGAIVQFAEDDLAGWTRRKGENVPVRKPPERETSDRHVAAVVNGFDLGALGKSKELRRSAAGGSR